MKKYLIAAAVLAISVTGAQAKCSTKSLNGQWMFGNDSNGLATPVVFTNGVAPFTLGTITVSLAKSCKGTITWTVGAQSATGRIATERISPLSSLKPNTLQIGFPPQPNITNGILFTFFRL